MRRIQRAEQIDHGMQSISFYRHGVDNQRGALVMADRIAMP
jgi:hypothetical protein